MTKLSQFSDIRDRRLAKGWSTLHCARQLDFKKEQIELIETGQLGKLPSGPRLKQIVSDYLFFLEFSVEEVDSFVQTLTQNTSPLGKSLFSRRSVNRQALWSFPQIVRNGLVVVVIIAIIVYVGLSLKTMFSPPQLQITYPEQDLVTSQYQLLLEGFTDPEVQLDINGEIVLSDRSGYFSQLISLRSGMNHLYITATKKYGGQTVVFRQVLVDN